ncbi:hypothetical protein ACHAWX_002961 [Stephanocyclus meneghinianus]
MFGQNQRPQSQRSASPTDEPCVKEFKVCIEEVKKEYPDLATGAVHHIAVQRFARRHEQPSHVDTMHKRATEHNALNNVFSKFRIGKSLSDAALQTAPKRSSTPPTMMSGDASGEEILPGRQRSLAPRKSVTLEEESQHSTTQFKRLESLDSNFSEHVDNLEKSLINIECEQSFNYNNRTSISSELDGDLSGVADDHDETEDFYVQLNDLKSLSEQLDEAEVKSPLENSNQVDTHADFITNTGQTKKRRSGRQRSVRSQLVDAQHSCEEEEGIFRGDFSAWRRFSRYSSMMSSRGSVSSISSGGDEDNFRAFMGDFTAWRSSRRSLRQYESD